jgi:Tol biopolymer transport system component
VLRVDVQTGDVTTLLAESLRLPLHPLLSPDGKTLFYSNMGTPRRIVRRDLLTGAEQDLYHTPEGTIESLMLSPDGKQLAFAEMPEPKPLSVPRSPDAPPILSFGMGHELKLIPATGGNVQTLVKADGIITTLAWTPDGRHLLFQRAFKRGVELWRVTAAGGEPKKLDIELPRMGHLRMHPDGRRITFAARNPDAEKREVWVLKNFLPPAKASDATATDATAEKAKPPPDAKL